MKVSAENTSFDLLPFGSEFPSRCVFETTEGDIPRRLKTAEAPFLPCLFPPLLPDSTPLASYLLWPSHREARAAWNAVSVGSYGDAHFTASIRAHFATKICFDCGRVFPTLSIDPGLPYCGAPELLLQKVRSWKMRSCARCGGSFRQLVVMIFNEPNQPPAP